MGCGGILVGLEGLGRDSDMDTLPQLLPTECPQQGLPEVPWTSNL